MLKLTEVFRGVSEKEMNMKTVFYVVPAVICFLAFAGVVPPLMADDGERTVSNLAHLTNNDWLESFDCKHDVYAEGGSLYERPRRIGYKTYVFAQYFSLIPTDDTTLSKGTVWVIGGRTNLQYSVSGNVRESDPVAHDAFKGKYELFINRSDRDILDIRVVFVKRYIVHRTGTRDPNTLEWELDSTFEPMGCTIEMPLDDGAVPATRLLFTGRDPFWVDVDGNEIEKRSRPRTTLEKLSGLGKIRQATPYSFKAFNLDRSLRLKKANIKESLYGENPPPTYRVRE